MKEQRWTTDLSELEARKLKTAAAYSGLTTKAYLTNVLRKHLLLIGEGAGPLATVLRNTPRKVDA